MGPVIPNSVLNCPWSCPPGLGGSWLGLFQHFGFRHIISIKVLLTQQIAKSSKMNWLHEGEGSSKLLTDAFGHTQRSHIYTEKSRSDKSTLGSEESAGHSADHPKTPHCLLLLCPMLEPSLFAPLFKAHFAGLCVTSSHFYQGGLSWGEFLFPSPWLLQHPGVLCLKLGMSQRKLNAKVGPGCFCPKHIFGILVALFCLVPVCDNFYLYPDLFPVHTH